MDTFEDQLLDAMYASFLERIKELPTPPPGYFYAPEIGEIRPSGDAYRLSDLLEVVRSERNAIGGDYNPRTIYEKQ